MITLNCKFCNEEFQTKNLKNLSKRTKYCSRSCLFSDIEFLKKMSESRLGQKAWNKDTKGIMKPNKTSFKPGQVSWNTGTNFSGMLGKHHTEESKLKSSKSNSRANSFNWQGGITKEKQKIRNGIETRLWRNSVFSRDGYTCQKYGTVGGKLHAHHIKNFAEYPELRFAIDNGITLSKEAHVEFHKIYGYKNNTMEQLYNFLNQESIWPQDIN